MRLLAVVLLVATAMPARAQLFPANEQRCLTPFETDALHLRLIQTYLMVNALACRRDADYNLFVRRQSSSLAQAFRLMQAHFGRHDGDGAGRAFDNMVVVAANRESIRAQRLGAEYCPGTATVWERVHGAGDAAALVAIAEEIDLPDHAEFPPPC